MVVIHRVIRKLCSQLLAKPGQEHRGLPVGPAQTGEHGCSLDRSSLSPGAHGQSELRGCRAPALTLPSNRRAGVRSRPRRRWQTRSAQKRREHEEKSGSTCNSGSQSIAQAPLGVPETFSGSHGFKIIFTAILKRYLPFHSLCLKSIQRHFPEPTRFVVSQRTEHTRDAGIQLSSVKANNKGLCKM